VLNSGAGGLVLLQALLREDSLFWRNAGGYAIWVRDLVYVLYYPSLLLYFAGVVGLSWFAFRLLAGGHKTGVLVFIISSVQWVLFFVIVIITLWNNVDNVLNGRPLHWHPPA
jgi:hypothetical protein